MFQYRFHFLFSKSLCRQRRFVYLIPVIIILLLPVTVMAASQVTLAWDANSEANLAGYRIYYKSGSSGEPYNGNGIDQGSSPVDVPLSSLSDSSNPEVTLTGLTESVDYYFVATAYDKYDNESAYSNEVILKAEPIPSPEDHQVKSSVSGNGTISPAGTTTVDDGGSLTYKIEAAAHHHIVKVMVDGKSVGTVSSYTFSNITADHTIAVSFAPDTYTISASAGSNGSISPAGTTTIAYGQSQTYTFTPDAGYHIVKVVVDGQAANTDSIYKFSNVSTNHTISVQFGINTYTVEVNASPNGTIAPSGKITVEHGASLTLKLTPDTGYHVDDVIIDGKSMGTMQSYTLNNVTSNHSITAKFGIMNASEPVIEFGELKIDHQWTRVLFKEKFIDPVVVAGPLGFNGGQPAIIRISKVDSAGFDIRVQEWPYLDGAHVKESVSYMVMERGSYLLADGTRLEASHFTTAGTEGEQSVLFEQSYNQVPVVVSAVVSFNETEAVVPRLNNIGTEGFLFRLQTQEADRSAPRAETIAYIAWEPTAGVLDGITYEIATSGKVVTDAFQALTFAANAGQTPAFIADMQSFNGTDSAGIRWRRKNTSSVQVQIDEEQSLDKEVRHVAENVGYILLSRIILDPDSDNDGLKDSDEALYGTDPQKVDSDNDGLGDAKELAYWGERWNNDIDNDGLINLLDKDSDNDGVSDGEEIDSGSDPGIAENNSNLPQIEVGRIQVNHNWTHVTLANTFQHPVVVAGPLSHTGDDPSVVRIRNVDSNGFDIRVQEWDYLNGRHTTETVSYLVIEQGQYQLSDGTRLEAAVFETNATVTHQPVNFAKACSVAPVVMSTITTYNESDAVAGRIKNITPQGFEYLLQEQEANGYGHAVESVAYLAWEPSNGKIGDLRFLITKTANEVPSDYSNIMFPQPFATTPVFLGDMQTTNGTDPANVRHNHLDRFAVDVMIDEEQSRTEEVYHLNEIVGYMVFGQ
jgi:hypothetical protein